MFLISSLILMILSIMMILMITANYISMKTFKDREKSSPFECGFDPKNSARLPFSIHFFLIALIFLIFDVEITLIIPFIYSMKYSNIMIISIMFFMFMAILILGLYHEWKQGALNWSL